MGGEGAQDGTRVVVPTRHQRQPFEANHGVAAPVGEPVIAGDDGARLVAGRLRPRRLLDTAGRRDEKLIGRQRPFAAGSGSRRRGGLRQQAPPSFVFGLPRHVRRQRVHRLPFFRRGHESDVVVRGQIDAKMSWTPQLAARLVAAFFFQPIQKRLRSLALHGERGAPADHAEAQRRHVGAVGDFVTVEDGRQGVGPLERRADLLFVGSKVDGQPQFQPHRALSLDQPVADMDRVLLVQQDNTFFQHPILDRPAPDGQADLQVEGAEEFDAVQVEGSAGRLLAAQAHRSSVRQPDLFGQVVEHHDAAQGRRQRGHEQAVIAARTHAGNRGRRITAQAVRYDPFALDQGATSSLLASVQRMRRISSSIGSPPLGLPARGATSPQRKQGNRITLACAAGWWASGPRPIRQADANRPPPPRRRPNRPHSARPRSSTALPSPCRHWEPAKAPARAPATSRDPD